MRLVEWLARRSEAQLTAICVPLVLLIGAIDYVTGKEISLSIFYLVPVSLAAWLVGQRAGGAISVASAVTWYVADLWAGASYSHPLIPCWNALVRFGFFVLMSLVLAALRKAYLGSEERFSRLVQGVKDYALILLDRDGVVNSWNTGAERIFGLGADEIVGRSISLLYPPEDAAAGKAARVLELAAAEGRAEEEGWHGRKGGARFWAHVIVTPLRNRVGAPGGFSLIVHDVTERRLSEQALRDAEERSRLLLDAFADLAVIQVDPQGRVASWNAGAERVFGYRAVEMIGAHFSRLYPEPDVAMGKFDEDLRAARAAGQLETFAWRVRKGGSRFWARVSLARMRDETGGDRGYSLLVREADESPAGGAGPAAGARQI